MVSANLLKKSLTIFKYFVKKSSKSTIRNVISYGTCMLAYPPLIWSKSSDADERQSFISCLNAERKRYFVNLLFSELNILITFKAAFFHNKDLLSFPFLKGIY